ncbi:hypothetical protein [Streptomyces alkaliterrae]|uniref:Uncharacterized protein n=1 Tax=Streptomyces alkaliterrae TaxID=2213162 RepID=A0A5P0YT78_9ACTN|nr:hypothetical protein [Streptomyces alkaliterrae]MBB1255132.1 hypothetical protein [Streptomyces alkaliterrae]MBB1259844.1 hypothetical protein [Streptomyces alkaliterrae]MQS03521.1 hypothetical protein [Streptomyces alkaliterrae]
MNALTSTDMLIAVGVLLPAILPAIVSTVREGGLADQLRAARRGRDTRTGVLVVFDLAYGRHGDRVRFAEAGREAEADRSDPADRHPGRRVD